jgi:hypothetical protein
MQKEKAKQILLSWAFLKYYTDKFLKLIRELLTEFYTFYLLSSIKKLKQVLMKKKKKKESNRFQIVERTK